MRWVAAALFALVSTCALAHKPSDSYLILRAEGTRLHGQWDIALRDLEYAIGLDENGDGEITWGELRVKHREIADYVLARLKISANGGGCELVPHAHLVDEHSDGSYAVLRFSGDCGTGAIAVLAVDYRLFFELDPTHRGLLRIEHAAGARAAVLSPERAQQSFELARTSRWAQFRDYLREGAWHILIGLDHVLFVLSLLLPAVLLGRAGSAFSRPATHFAPVFWDVFRIVTAFTVAHSVTLTLAALAVIALPSRLVESAIALSVVLAALNNLFPVVVRARWMVAFGFGLLHGFGFASVLADLGLPQGALALALVAFNLGVEAGQLAIVATFLPLAWAIRSSRFYRRVVFAGGSTVIASLAALWLIERALDLKLLPW